MCRRAIEDAAYLNFPTAPLLGTKTPKSSYPALISATRTITNRMGSTIAAIESQSILLGGGIGIPLCMKRLSHRAPAYGPVRKGVRNELASAQ